MTEDWYYCQVCRARKLRSGLERFVDKDATDSLSGRPVRCKEIKLVCKHWKVISQEVR